MDQPPRTLPPKKEVLVSLLEQSSVRVFLDPRRDGVMVPGFLAKQAELVLRLGLDLRPPIPDLVIGEDQVTCTLSFNRAPFKCALPWSAIYAIISDDPTEGRGSVWPDDVPVESQLVTPTRPKPRLAALRDPEAELAAPPAEPRPPRARRDVRPQPARRPAMSDLARLEGESASGSQKGDASAEKKPKRPLPPYLRVVK
jgi:stringent starvation protein B